MAEELPPHVQRMEVEFEGLNARTDKLAEFIATNPAFEQLDDYEQNMMQLQLNSMKSYRFVLSLRLERAKRG